MSDDTYLLAEHELDDGTMIAATWEGGRDVVVLVFTDPCEAAEVATWSIWDADEDAPLIPYELPAFMQYFADRLVEPGLVEQLVERAG